MVVGVAVVVVPTRGDFILFGNLADGNATGNTYKDIHRPCSMVRGQDLMRILLNILLNMLDRSEVQWSFGHDRDCFQNQFL